jgi:uncharacterized membrane protein YfcA
MSFLQLLMMYLFAGVTSVVSGVFGALGGVILLALMLMLLPYQQAVPLHALVQLASNSSRVFFLRREVDRAVVFFFALGLPLGSWGAYRVLTLLPNPEWALIFVIALLLYVGLKPARMPDLALPTWGYLPLGIVTGAVGPLIGAVGPLLIAFFVRKDVPKERIIATQGACQILVHLAKLPVFFALGFSYREHLPLLIGMIAAVVVGSKLGTMALRALKPEHFMLLLRATVLVIAGKLLYSLTSRW